MEPVPTVHERNTLHLSGVKYILKFIKLYALKKAKTRAILKKLENDYIPTTGKPEEVVTNNGTQFTLNS